jgi:8-oxo-dGTP pyrophosphatase MutT (NUDIX family)
LRGLARKFSQPSVAITRDQAIVGVSRRAMAWVKANSITIPGPSFVVTGRACRGWFRFVGAWRKLQTFIIPGVSVTLSSDSPPTPTAGDIPKRSADQLHPVKPKDSASMLVLRKGAGGLEVLMGRRGRKAVFSNAYVFAGGKVDKIDSAPVPATPLDPDLERRISSSPAKARVFAMAAVRETFEETGLMLGAPGDLGQTGAESWDEMRALGLAPALDKLSYVGHAITPASRVVRFNARFFCAWEEDMTGTLGGSGELADLAYLPIQDALKLQMVDVTQFMLEEMLRREDNDFATPTSYPFFGYRKDRRYHRYK